MKILILGGDGYLGWPTAMNLSQNNHEVLVVDNYLRRIMAESTDSDSLIPAPNLSERVKLFEEISNRKIHTSIGDLTDSDFMDSIVKEFMPDCIIHYAEQPSAPYSMKGAKEAKQTFKNNLDVTFNVIWALIQFAPNCHLVKLGTMGEYGTPNIDIEEGWIEIEHKGRKQKFLYPRAAGSLYHTTKILDTDLLWFYVRAYGLKVTDLMQGPVYGLLTPETLLDEKLLPSFHYDDIFGTVVNRFLIQSIAGVPLTVYGKGGQTRGYLNLLDTLQCVKLASENPANNGELRIFNQITETFTVNELANRIKKAGDIIGLNVKIESISNPRQEMEEHYYNPSHTGLMELGLEPNYMSEEVLGELLNKLMLYKDRIIKRRILPRVKWK